ERFRTFTLDHPRVRARSLRGVFRRAGSRDLVRIRRVPPTNGSDHYAPHRANADTESYDRLRLRERPRFGEIRTRGGDENSAGWRRHSTGIRFLHRRYTRCAAKCRDYAAEEAAPMVHAPDDKCEIDDTREHYAADRHDGSLRRAVERQV